MNLWHAAILGLVEGITEYLPISSTGHLIIVAAWLGLGESPDAKRAVDAFNIIIQGGAILAVLGLYQRRVLQMTRGLLGRDRGGLRLARNLFIAFLPAAVLGVMLNDLIARHLFYPRPVIGALAIGGVIMIVIGCWQRSFFHGDEHTEPHDAHSYVDIEHLTWRRALLIGLLQCLAMWPGTSRSMVTIVGGMMVGLRPRQAAEFSFLLGLPTLGGACVYSAIKNFRGAHEQTVLAAIGWAPMLVGLIVATLSAMIAIKWLVAFLGRHGLSLFGWYRLAFAALVAFLVWRGDVRIAPETAPAPSASSDVSHEKPLGPSAATAR